MNPDILLLILRLLDMLATIALRAPVVRQEFATLRGQIETMVREDRGPSPEEWESLNQRADLLHAQIQGTSDPE